MSETVVTDLGTFTVWQPDYAVINELPTSCDGWECVEGNDGLLLPAPRRGTANDVIPGADGTLPNPQYGDELDITLTFAVDAHRHYDGEASPQAPAYRSLLAMRQAWGEIPDNTDSTVPVEFHVQGDVWEGDAQIADLRWGNLSAVLRLIIPAGQLTIVEVSSS